MSYLNDIAMDNRFSGEHDKMGGLEFQTAENTFSLSVYLVSDQLPVQLLARAAEIKGRGSDHGAQNQSGKHTLIGLIQI